jgi:hypothetical protein
MTIKKTFGYVSKWYIYIWIVACGVMLGMYHLVGDAPDLVITIYHWIAAYALYGTIPGMYIFMYYLIRSDECKTMSCSNISLLEVCDVYLLPALSTIIVRQGFFC